MDMFVATAPLLSAHAACGLDASEKVLREQVNETSGPAKIDRLRRNRHVLHNVIIIALILATASVAVGLRDNAKRRHKRVELPRPMLAMAIALPVINRR